MGLRDRLEFSRWVSDDAKHAAEKGETRETKKEKKNFRRTEGGGGRAERFMLSFVLTRMILRLEISARGGNCNLIIEFPDRRRWLFVLMMIKSGGPREKFQLRMHGKIFSAAQQNFPVIDFDLFFALKLSSRTFSSSHKAKGAISNNAKEATINDVMA